MPIANARYRFKQVNPNEKVRLTFVDNKVVEVRPYFKKNGTYVPGHLKKIKQTK